MDSAWHAANEDVGRTGEGVALINDAGFFPFSPPFSLPESA